jgi:hypothetical protein
VWCLIADVSEHRVCSIFIGDGFQLQDAYFNISCSCNSISSTSANICEIFSFVLSLGVVIKTCVTVSLFMVCTCLSTITFNSHIQWIDERRAWSTHQCHVSWESTVTTLLHTHPYQNAWPQTGAVFYRILTQVADTNDGDQHASTAMSLAEW